MLIELRQALRPLVRARGFAAVVVLILGLGIGANTAIFSVVRAVLLRPPPFAEPERLVRLYESFGTGGDEAQLALAPITWRRWRESNAVFEDIGAATGTSLTLGGGGEAPQYVPGARVSFNFFSVLGVKPVRGRDFREEEDQPGARPVVLLGHGLWQRRFGGADVLERDVLLDGVPHTIVGVMPPSFRHPYRAELWVPLALRIDPVLTTGRFLYAPARLRPGVGIDRRHWPGQDPIGKSIKRGRPDDPRPPYVVVGVAADVKGIADATDGDVPGVWYLPYPQNPGFLTNDVSFVVHASVPPAALETSVRQALAGVDPRLAPYDFTTVDRMTEDSYVQDRFAALLVGLFGALGLVLSALGLYGLLSFQVAQRTRELGVRAALGARSGDILSLVFRDGALLVVPGLVLGLACALALTRLLGSQLHGVDATDPLSYAAAAIVLCFAAGLASWLPARRAARVDPMVALRSE